MGDSGNLTTRRWLRITVPFVAGIVFTLGATRLLHASTRHFCKQNLHEIARTTSPDGAVDAVLLINGCGAMCADNYLVTVVPKGANAPADIENYLFSADEMAEGQIRWRQSHLLEISHNKRLIYRFRNLSYPFAKPGNMGSWKYQVEVRLAPASPDFSYLQRATVH
jgi:hypothetical protein